MTIQEKVLVLHLAKVIIKKQIDVDSNNVLGYEELTNNKKLIVSM